MHPALPIATVLGSCCSCVVYLEFLAKEDPGSMNLLTFAEFLFITIEGIIFTTNFFTKKNQIPIRSYFTMVLIFFGVNVINNQALNFQIPVPLHIIFRSGSLLANMLLGVWLLNKRYSVQKYASVLVITLGIVICTLMSSSPAAKKGESSVETEDKYMDWLIGVAMLTFALFFSALLGIYQERLYAQFGKHPREALFYAHALPLPGFLLFTNDIIKHLRIFNESAPYTIPYVQIDVPVLWWYLIVSVLTQYVCIRSVYTLTSECPSLTVTLVVTLRKFVSLLISIVYFQNPFTFMHWVGTALVFGGTLVFSDVHIQAARLLAPKKKDAKTE